MKAKLWSALLLLGCAGALTGCGQAASAASSTNVPAVSPSPSPSPLWRAGVSFSGPVTSSTDSRKTGVSLRPPAAGQVPAVAWSTVVSTCESGDAVCERGFPLTISIARATSHSAGSLGPNNTIIPLMNDDLVYVVGQSGVPCVPVGPAGATSTPTPRTCDISNFISAKTGNVFYSARYPIN